MQLHDELELSEDATPEQVKAAFRAAAAKLHPDLPGGDEAAFKRVNHAYLILSDPDKRKEYERTGQENTASPAERENAMALELIAKSLHEIVKMAEFDPALHDPVKAVRKMIKLERKEAENEITAVDTVLKKLRKTYKRLKRKGKGAGKAEAILDAMGRDTQQQKEKAERRVRVCIKATAVLSDYDYEIDQPTEQERAAAEAMVRLREQITLRFGNMATEKGVGSG